MRTHTVECSAGNCSYEPCHPLVLRMVGERQRSRSTRWKLRRGRQLTDTGAPTGLEPMRFSMFISGNVLFGGAVAYLIARYVVALTIYG